MLPVHVFAHFAAVLAHQMVHAVLSRAMREVGGHRPPEQCPWVDET